MSQSGDGKRRAIVVDDSAATRMILKQMVSELGFEPDEAADGMAALEKIEGDGPYDLALVDWHMPRMNGLELVQAIRANPELGDLCILMVTTEAALESVMLALEAGANEFVMKPFTTEMIRAKLELMEASP